MAVHQDESLIDIFPQDSIGLNAAAFNYSNKPMLKHAILGIIKSQKKN
ncbi:MAG: hypothetical protein Rpha_0036 [Candidatus Ruthia sp. Apha_13_S6]|nr:hypothetical protein [Candidatus Ruthia sp. Apha_13_S6]MBW5289238.1 hypothetical protein [Candidatus Ruthia sp. Apha_13_S6]MBW5289378.1 hypothetical protein [Candidatus Ruthia sp. Apha_13_S6]